MKEAKDTVIKRYLLGELNEDDREQVEQGLITDRKFLDEVLMVEEELLEDYVSGLLPQHERDLFLKNYLSSPRQRQKLRIAHALDKYVAQSTVPAPTLTAAQSWLQRLIYSLGLHKSLAQLSWAVLVLIVFAGTWWIVSTWRDKSKLEAELIRLNGPESSVLEADSTVAQAVLLPLNLREAGSMPAVTVTNQTQVVQLKIPVSSEPEQNYQAVLRDSGGQEIVRVSQLAPREVGNERMVILQLPAIIVQPGEYVINVEAVGDYSFRVLR
jgi:hypothetical protein